MTSPTPTEDKNESGFRIFLSYAHADADCAKKIEDILLELHHVVLWDQNIRPGTPFTDSIKSLIQRSHLFIPIITRNSQGRPWVHQETGYAIALDIPVLPLAIGKLPAEMTAALQAITIKEDLSDLESKLKVIDFEHLILPNSKQPGGSVKVAEWPETRAENLVSYAHWVLGLNEYGYIRYQGALSSFSIPDYNLDAKFWACRDGTHLRSDYYHHLQREERRVLARHAWEKGCSLILDPYTTIFDQRGDHSRAVRLMILLEFINRFIQEKQQDKLHVIFSPTASKGDLVIVGNYFFAESMAPRSGGFYQTVFNAHPPTVLERLRQFDQEFNSLKSTCGETAEDAAAEIQKILDSLDDKHKCIDFENCKKYSPKCDEGQSK